MRKRREEQEREALERPKKEQEKAERLKRAEERKRAAKAKVKADRSNEATRRACEQREKDAQLRMAKAQLKEKHDKFWREMKANGDDVTMHELEYTIDIGWTKTKGAAKCLFCDEDIKYYSFRCAEGGAVACNPCKNHMCRFVPLQQDGSENEGCGATNVNGHDKHDEEEMYAGTESDPINLDTDDADGNGGATQKKERVGTSWYQQKVRNRFGNFTGNLNAVAFKTELAVR
ncbi:hypothetical protein EK21DRAFT_108342 [Setomelanomma holmii]|uniref:Uncharacterized protein n=1 Tax=Setomelanomma holmii TaxID=210430 RepID=A0A9P4HI04_9PLEO|nr:hypothetical protein EK21DRAFT_108342 [Setomelanomma holmii]